MESKNLSIGGRWNGKEFNEVGLVWPEFGKMGVINDHIEIRDLERELKPNLYEVEVRMGFNKGGGWGDDIRYTVIDGEEERIYDRPAEMRGWTLIQKICKNVEQSTAIDQASQAAEDLQLPLYVLLKDQTRQVYWCPKEWEPIIG